MRQHTVFSGLAHLLPDLVLEICISVWFRAALAEWLFLAL